MKTQVLVPIFLILLAMFALAITSNDAVKLVVTQSHYLDADETYTPPNVPISVGENEYWVVPLIAGSSTLTYFPVDSRTGELSVSRAANREIFGIADSLRRVQDFKNSISKNSGVEWIFTQKYSTIFNEISLNASDEVFQINTVESTLRQNSMNTDLSALKSRLSSISSQSLQASSAITSAASAESAFFTRPSDASFTEMKVSFDEVFGLVSQLSGNILTYSSESGKLKQQISLADMDAQTKSQLFAILEIPQGLQEVRNYNLFSQQISSSIESTFNESSLSIDALLDEFDKRVAKNDTYNLIYSENEKIKKEFTVSSLSEAQAIILVKDAQPLWANQERTRSLQDNYSRAVKLYNEQNYDSSKKYAALAIDDAVAVHKAGQKQASGQSPVLSQDFLFKLAAVLIGLLVLLYIFNNRGKIKEKISGDGESIDVYS